MVLFIGDQFPCSRCILESFFVPYLSNLIVFDILHLFNCINGLQVLWSFGIAYIDMYDLRIKHYLQNPLVVSLFFLESGMYFLFFVFFFLKQCFKFSVVRYT